MQAKLKEMIFLRDLHFGFLPDDCEDEFNDCFQRIGKVRFDFFLIIFLLLLLLTKLFPLTSHLNMCLTH